MTVAALYVDARGIYAGLEGVDVWDEARDARYYRGPYPVVAHPPCLVWSLMSLCRPEIVRGADGGCFESALGAVRMFGGVLEHPAYSQAWERYALPYASRYGWTTAIGDPGYATEVDQARYGHPCNKRTWLYYCGPNPPALRWGDAPFTGRKVHDDGGGGRDARSRTPLEFRDALLSMAASAAKPKWVRGLSALH